MTQVISPGLSPNTQTDDVVRALMQILSFWNYKKGKAIGDVEAWFERYFSTSHAISFINARSALFAILTALRIGKGDEVIIQGFTCIVVPDPIIATGAKPIYADVTAELTLDYKSVEEKITKKTKAIIVQHTFGIPSDMESLVLLARKHNIYIIEDVAHTIGETYKNKKLGTFGVAAIFSLGRDKAFSSVFGGIALTSSDLLAKKLKSYQRTRAYPSVFWTTQQLLHPILFSLILPLYTVGILGKALLVFFQKLHLLSFPVSSHEKRGKFFPSEVKRYPNALALLALHQLEKIDRYNAKRKMIANQYKKVCLELGIPYVSKKNISFLRFPILSDHPTVMRKFFKERGIYLGNWYANVIDPKESNFSAVYYKKGMTPNAEKLAKKIVNLPTYPTMTNEDVERVVQALKEYAGS